MKRRVATSLYSRFSLFFPHTNHKIPRPQITVTACYHQLCLRHTYVFTLFGKVIEKTTTDLEYLSPQKKLKKARRNLIKVQVHTSICLRPKKALIFYDRTEKLFFLAHTFFVLIFQAKGEIMNKKGWHERAKRE